MRDKRQRIDEIDQKIMDLLEERFSITKEIGLDKQKKRLTIEDKKREEEILGKTQKYIYAEEISKIYNLLFSLNKKYQSFTYGLIGKNLEYSFSKLIYEQLGLQDYTLLQSDNFQNTVAKLNYSGLNVTNPYKKDAYSYCDLLDSSAEATGVVNCIIDKTGYNTDFLAVKEIINFYNIDFTNKRIIIIGNGATATTIEHAIGKKVVKLVRHIRGDNEYLLNDYEKFLDAHYIFNATPYGMYPNIANSFFFHLDGFKHLELVFDVVYNPLESPLLQAVKRKPIRKICGLEMLFRQALINYYLFTGKKVDEPRKKYYLFKKNLLNVVFIGMSFSGKSTIGKRFARYMNKTFIDIDKELEKEGHDLNTIYEDEGIKVFREYENRKIKEVATRFSLVIATGGGVILNDENMHYLDSNGIIIYINPSLDTLYARMDCSRPLLKNRDDLCKMFIERKAKYEKYADIIINGDESDEEIGEKIDEYLSN